jgi:integration host factor subunit alpha
MKRYTTDLIRTLAHQHRRSQAHYRQALTEILGGITAQLAEGHSLQLTTFGTFYTRLRSESSLKNLATGQRMTVAPRRVAAFRVGELLKHAVRKHATPKKPKPSRKTKQ